MVDLQDAANVALIVSLGANAWNYFYGPWARRRKERREAAARIEKEIQGAKAAARNPIMAGYIAHFNTWAADAPALSRTSRKEVAPFRNLCVSYWDGYLVASKVVRLATYEAVAQATRFRRGPRARTGSPATLRAATAPTATWARPSQWS